MVGFDLSVEQPVLLYPRVAVHRPSELEGISATLVGLVPEYSGGGPAVHFDVSSEESWEEN